MRPFLPFILALLLQSTPGAEPFPTNPVPLTASANGPPAGAAAGTVAAVADSAGPEFAELQRQIAAVLIRTHTPGAAVALVTREGTVWTAGFGLADLETHRPVTPDTLFRVGSVSKIFPSLALLTLQTEGKLQLDDTLKSRAPDLSFFNPWESTDPVRLVHLLEHTAGWDDWSLAEFGQRPAADGTLRDGLAFHPRTRTSRWRPGTRYSYSNAGPAAAAYVVEQVSGERYEDYVQRHWFQPLGMPTASFLDSPKVESLLSRTYQPDNRTAIPYWHLLERPAGALNASVRELSHVVQFLLNRGNFGGIQLLPAALIDRLEHATSTYAAAAGLATGYGLGNYTTSVDGWVYHGHDGSVPGSLAGLAYLPDAGVGYVYAVNVNAAAANEIRHLLCTHLTRSLSPPPKTAITTAALSPAVKNHYAGWYQPISARFDFGESWLRLLGFSRLTFRATDIVWSPLLDRRNVFVPTSEHRWRRPADPLPTLALVSDRSDGTLIQFSEAHGGNATAGQTFRRVPVWTMMIELLVAALTPLVMLTTLVSALWWLPRQLRGKVSASGHLSVRVLPLLSTLCGTVLFVHIARPAPDFTQVAARATPSSALVLELMTAMTLLATLGLVQTLRHHRQKNRPLAWWHSLIASGVLALFGGYFVYWGLVGLRTWL